MGKKINKDLTAEQKLVLFEDGTEVPGTSKLNYEKSFFFTDYFSIIFKRLCH